MKRCGSFSVNFYSFHPIELKLGGLIINAKPESCDLTEKQNGGESRASLTATQLGEVKQIIGDAITVQSLYNAMLWCIGLGHIVSELCNKGTIL